ncbi:MAG: cyclic nucleotide-binding domain-containing protein [Candidatus Dadabacteria bacterium]|nr:cyclic nucleotide-binding domain-containing protein [Candidatus Dadabacteria bacterium]NIQ13949.1 cyclic nucleotide-binding domain-containing protein [Candidatus Dadabacteria bacterium]
MKIKNIVDLLEEHSFFDDLDHEFIEIIAGCCSNKNFKPGEYIFKEGEDANNFYIIRHGKVALEISHHSRGPIILETIDEKDVLGWSWLFPPYKWFLNARAIDIVRTVAIDGKCLREKFDNNPKLGYELMKCFSKIVVDRLQGTRLRLLDLYGNK